MRFLDLILYFTVFGAIPYDSIYFLSFSYLGCFFPIILKIVLFSLEKLYTEVIIWVLAYLKDFLLLSHVNDKVAGFRILGHGIFHSKDLSSSFFGN